MCPLQKCEAFRGIVADEEDAAYFRARGGFAVFGGNPDTYE